MLQEKTLVTTELIESQTAVELPDRHMMALVNLVLITGDIVTINVRDVNIGLNICANVLGRSALACTVLP